MVLASLGCSPEPAPKLPNVLLVTIDTLRADFVHSYGFEKATTPNIDALGARGAMFELAFAASTATVPSHASIMTSRNVREHSVGSQNGPTRLEGQTTLAERFREAGYETAAFVSNVVLKARSGLDRGFSLYDDDLPEAESNRAMYFERNAEQTGARALAWLQQPREAPFLLWVHLQDPHGPYTPPPPYDTSVAEVPLRATRPLSVLRKNRGRGGLPSYQAQGDERSAARYAGLYAGEVSFADAWAGRLLETAGANPARDLVVLLTADHGESLDEQGFFFQHGHSTTPEQARVPFIVVAPGIAPARLETVVHHVDIAPTLLELAGLPPLDTQSGVSLVPHLMHAAVLPERHVLTDIGSEVTAYDAHGYVTVRVRQSASAAGTPGDAAAGEIEREDLVWQRFGRVEALDGQGGKEVRGKGPRWESVGRGSLLADEIVAYLSAAEPLVPALAMSEADVARLRALGYLPPQTTDTEDPEHKPPVPEER